MKLTDHIQRRPDLVAAEMDDHMVMMDIETGKYYNLDEVGAEIWKLLETDHTPAELIEALTALYDVDRETCQKQTMSFLEQLAERDLICNA